jgi:hypothetical protein
MVVASDALGVKSVASRAALASAMVRMVVKREVMLFSFPIS